MSGAGLVFPIPQRGIFLSADVAFLSNVVVCWVLLVGLVHIFCLCFSDSGDGHNWDLSYNYFLLWFSLLSKFVFSSTVISSWFDRDLVKQLLKLFVVSLEPLGSNLWVCPLVSNILIFWVVLFIMILPNKTYKYSQLCSHILFKNNSSHFKGYSTHYNCKTFISTVQNCLKVVTTLASQWQGSGSNPLWVTLYVLPVHARFFFQPLQLPDKVQKDVSKDD